MAIFEAAKPAASSSINDQALAAVTRRRLKVRMIATIATMTARILAPSTTNVADDSAPAS